MCQQQLCWLENCPNSQLSQLAIVTCVRLAVDNCPVDSYPRTGCFHFFTEKEVFLCGAIMDTPHQCNKLIAIENIGSLIILDGDLQATSLHM